MDIEAKKAGLKKYSKLAQETQHVIEDFLSQPETLNQEDVVELRSLRSQVVAMRSLLRDYRKNRLDFTAVAYASIKSEYNQINDKMDKIFGDTEEEESAESTESISDEESVEEPPKRSKAQSPPPTKSKPKTKSITKSKPKETSSKKKG